MIFIDTSAVYALADRADENHKSAKEILRTLINNHEELVTHNYIIVESAALLQNRLGVSPAITFLQEVKQFSIIWIDEILHDAAREYFEKQGKRNLSFVDCASFVVMQQQRIEQALAFDKDFTKAGFEATSHNR